ncbi:hypothetical protein MGYG_08473 [Nannizzia gypsea CBS 118893]|uniref:MARVEL domain-containing protein n=1 Tax=Arthroderma gypseum (strain ATCC MYA-4604 / CBS 118893) TaxID=535722 RepID=E4V5T5_ARTGP|nr:hypothetical protein MGYG_08473 [Nannizzia gypsea CBS 118893]EFR05460.1 hypothetical protein MGYG_08473 [Nannizzia gypsea CBS 118893]
MGLMSGIVRAALMGSRLMQFACAGIVLGVSGYFVNRYETNGHLKYFIIIASLSIFFFLPGLLSPIIRTLGFMTFFIDLIFSYLWLTAFIFAVQDYSRSDCANNTPRGGQCKYKRLIEAFTIGAMWFCICSLVLEVMNVMSHHREKSSYDGGHHKEMRRSGDTARNDTYGRHI